MTNNKKKSGNPPEKIIALNRKAQFDYFLEDRFEAGLVLEGWEIKAIRGGRVQIKDSYVLAKGDEVWLLGSQITPLATVSTHVKPDPTRSRKLLLNRREINKIRGATQREGYTVIATNLHWSHNRVKLEIALAKGKKQYDKRETQREREWHRQKHRALRRA